VAERIVANWIGSGGGVGDLRDFLEASAGCAKACGAPFQPPLVPASVDPCAHEAREPGVLTRV
jgi:hypothetical protein